jgi:4-hydroxy-tetrahydrodipicolinate synthase
MMQPLTGSFVALITPMFPDGTIDYDSLKSLIDWHVRSGTSGIVAVGTTGESATLLIEEHIKVIENTVNYVNGRIPVIAGSGSNSTAQAIETTIESKKVGADYALLVTPYYNKPTQKGLIKHYLKIADTVEFDPEPAITGILPFT